MALKLWETIMEKTMLRQGVVMEQHKEPALSRDIKRLKPDRVKRIEGYEPVSGADAAEPEQIIAAAKSAHIIDERDGKPLWKKLKAAAGKDVTVLVDAIDDEPYISSQMGPMLYYREQCVSGLRLAQKALGTENAEILIYKNITALETHIPSAVCGVPVRRIGGAYPAEARSERGLPPSDGRLHLYLGACALIHLHRAVLEGVMQTTAFVTVNGNCVGSPRNLEMPIGDTASDALDACGLIDEPSRVVIGGSMTGTSISDPAAAVISPTTRAVLAFRGEERSANYVCIGCGRCIRSCPQGLSPMYIYSGLEAGRLNLLPELDPQDCIGCMTCSYVCPARLDLAEAIGEYNRKRSAVSHDL